MISILIVEDNPNKITAIKTVLNEYPEITAIHVSSDTNNARRLLENQKFDLLILDLVLPNDFGDTVSPENGIEFLNEISIDPNKKCPYHIIGISAYSEYINQYSDGFRKNLWYLIEYQEGVEEWKEILRNKLEYLLNSKSELSGTMSLEHDFDVAIITALGKELSKVLQLDGKWKEKILANDGTEYHIGQFRKGDKIIRLVAACTPQMGMCASTTLSMKMIAHFKPKYMIMCGIAAAVEGEINLGDILVAEEIWDGGSGKVKSDGSKGTLFLPDPKHKTLNTDIREKILALKRKRTYLDEIRQNYPNEPPKDALNIHIGPMASVPAVIQSNAELERIKSHSRKLIGIEMEGYGVFYSGDHCPKPRPIVIVMKSACDFANEDKNNALQDYAAYTSAAYMEKVILNNLTYEGGKQQV